MPPTRRPLSHDERIRHFGRPCSSQRLLITTPWRNARGLAIRVQVHPLIADVFLDACHAAAADCPEWKPRRIDSYNCRPIRGSDSWSTHAWALGFDFFATDPDVPPPGGVWKPDNTVPEAFARCFIERGFRWGRYFTRQDWPHIEWPFAPPSASSAPEPPPVEEDTEMKLIRARGAAEIFLVVGDHIEHVTDTDIASELEAVAGPVREMSGEAVRFLIGVCQSS